jgi:dihydroorotase/allantoinase
MEEIGSFDGTVLLHAENDEMIKHYTNKMKANGRTDYRSFLESRPPEAEAMAIEQALFIIKRTGGRGIFLHTTVPEGVETIREARNDGHDVWVETGPHILNITEADVEERGPWVTFSPPPRDRQRVEELWEQLAAGDIHLLASDHGPVKRELIEAGEENIWDGMPGVPGIETLVPLAIDAVSEGRIELETIAATLGENPAKLYGLYPRKGSIQVGADADFTIIDMTDSQEIRADELYTSCGWTPFEGRTIQGGITHTIVQGEVVAKNGEVLGSPGDGAFVPRLDS